MVTASAAIAVGVVAYRQWRVAREKLVLDLFDRRFAWYVDYKEQLMKPLSNTRQNIVDAYLAQSRLSDESRFLFGGEILATTMPTLNALQRVIMAVDIEAKKSEDPAAPVLHAKNEYIAIVGPQLENLPKLVLPYMRMHQKL